MHSFFITFVQVHTFNRNAHVGHSHTSPCALCRAQHVSHTRTQQGAQVHSALGCILFQAATLQGSSLSPQYRRKPENHMQQAVICNTTPTAVSGMRQARNNTTRHQTHANFTLGTDLTSKRRDVEQVHVPQTDQSVRVTSHGRPSHCIRPHGSFACLRAHPLRQGMLLNFKPQFAPYIYTQTCQVRDPHSHSIHSTPHLLGT